MTIPLNNIPEWDEHNYETLWPVILGHVSENISVSLIVTKHRKHNQESNFNSTAFSLSASRPCNLKLKTD